MLLTGSRLRGAKSDGVRLRGSAGNTAELNLYNEVAIAGGNYDEVYDILGERESDTINNYGTLTTAGSINLGELFQIEEEGPE